MSRREDVDNSIWGDPDFSAATPHAKLVYLWSFTNPRCNMAGLYMVPPAHIAAETGLSKRKVELALGELQEARLVYYVDGVLWVRSRVKHLRTTNKLMARSVLKSVEQFNGHPLADAFRAMYDGCVWLERGREEKPSV